MSLITYGTYCFVIVTFDICWYYIIHIFLFQQARAEQEEEFISNTLLKKINDLKKEKETLAKNYEQEEEFLTNDLTRKLLQVGAIPKYICLLLKNWATELINGGGGMLHTERRWG